MYYWYHYPYTTCGTCGGNGVSGGSTCWTCGGAGVIYKRVTPQPPPFIPPYRPPAPVVPPAPAKWVPKCNCNDPYTSVCPVHPGGPPKSTVT